jgi:hypothetical protein
MPSVATAASKSFSAPEETRTFPNGKLDIVDVGGNKVGQATFQPGWKWSESIKPIAGTDSCMSTHIGFVQSGRMKVVMDDGTELNFGPNDAMSLPAGHDAWVVGNEPCVVVDFVGFENYAKPR